MLKLIKSYPLYGENYKKITRYNFHCDVMTLIIEYLRFTEYKQQGLNESIFELPEALGIFFYAFMRQSKKMKTAHQQLPKTITFNMISMFIGIMINEINEKHVYNMLYFNP